MKKSILITLLSALCALGQAQTLTLEECYELARANFPQVRRLQLIERTRDCNLANAAKGWLPQLALTGKAQVQSDVTQLPFDFKQLGLGNIDIPTPDKDQYALSLDLNQTIYDGGAISSSKDLAGKQADVERGETEVSLYALRGRVNELFFSILLVDERLRLHHYYMDNLRLAAERIAACVQHGTAVESDVWAVEAEQASAERTQVELKGRRAAYMQMLSLLIGKTLGAEAELARPKADFSETAGNFRPELSLFQAREAHIDARQKQLDTALRPKLGLFASGSYGRPGLNIFERDFGFYGVIGARLTWNFSPLYTRRTDRRLLEIQRENVAADRETFLLNNDIDAANHRSAMKRISDQITYDDRIIRLRADLTKARADKLELGAATATDLMRDMNDEQAARLEKAYHELQLLQTIYNLKYTRNQ